MSLMDSPQGLRNSLRNRARIAQAAARLIAEHGITDWGMAKRKACRELGLGERESLPGREEIEQALRDYNNLFRPVEHAASIRALRTEALRWMERLDAWNPVLVGGVAAGWASEHSEPRLELEAEDAKNVEMALLNDKVAYAALPARDRGTLLRVGTGDDTVLLVVLSPQERRNRRRSQDDDRLTAAELRALLPGSATDQG